MRTPIHWPHRSGYFASSNAWAAEQVATSARPIAPSAFRYCMVFPLVIDSNPRAAAATGHVEMKLLGEPKKEPAEEAAPAEGMLPIIVVGSSARSRR